MTIYATCAADCPPEGHRDGEYCRATSGGPAREGMSAGCPQCGALLDPDGTCFVCPTVPEKAEVVRRPGPSRSTGDHPEHLDVCSNCQRQSCRCPSLEQVPYSTYPNERAPVRDTAPTAVPNGRARPAVPVDTRGSRHPKQPPRPRGDTTEGPALLDQLHDALTRYVVFPTPQAADAVTLWIAATHGQQAWEHAPRCAVISPEKRCGKSRLVDVAEATAYRSVVTVNISPAALVRSIGEEDPPTLFIDEADTIFGPKAADNHEDLRGIVNSGHQRGRPYIRYDITTRRNESLATFCMAMLAGIGDLPDTIMDRAVVVRMRRRSPAETVAPYRTRRDGPPLHELRDALNFWVGEHVKELTEAVPDMPVEDRAADTWEPLVAVADLAGGAWPKRARKAVMVMVAAQDTADVEASLGVRLLGDIRAVFTEWTVSFLPSAELVRALRGIEDGPWADMDLTTRRLSARLKPYGVEPGHNAAKTARGYQRAAFADAFSRYLPSKSVQASAQAADQEKRSDASKAPDGSIRPDEISVRSVSAGQTTFSDARTRPDAGARAWADDLYDRER